MALFLNLYLGHLLGDFLLQPGRLVIAKRDGTPGLILHTLILGGCTVAVLAGTLDADWPAAVFVTGLHLVVERLTILTYVKTPTRGLYTLLLDQTVHALSIALVVWLLGAWHPSLTAVTFGIGLPIRTLAATVGLLTVSLFGSILVFEAVNAFMGGPDAKGDVLRFDAARIGGFVERGIALAAALGIHPAALMVPFLPRVARALTLSGETRNRLLLEAAVGAALCATVFVAVELVSVFVDGTLTARLGGAAVGVALSLLRIPS